MGFDSEDHEKLHIDITDFFKAFFKGKAPPMALSSKQYVFDNYRIQEFSEDITLPSTDSTYFSEEHTPAFCYEKYRVHESVVLKATLPKGKYIEWDLNEKYRAYNPVEETPQIFSEFAKLASRGKVSEEKCLGFVKKYGVIRNFEMRGLNVKWGFLYPTYPLEAMKLYAKEAFFISKLYHLINNKENAVRNHLKELLKYIPEEFLFDMDNIKWPELLREEWKNLDPPFKKKLERFFLLPDHLLKATPEPIEFFSKDEKIKKDWTDEDEATDEELEEYNKYLRVNAPISFTKLAGSDFWDTVVAEASIELLKKISAVIIAEVVSFRLRDEISFYTTSVYEQNKVRFVNHWSGHSLLATMWFLFFLEITGLMVKPYTICQFCFMPILPKEGKKTVPRNKIFCNAACKQAKHRRDKKERKELEKENNTTKGHKKE